MGPDSLGSMVERVSWFSPIDYEILLFFERHNIKISPKGLSVNIDYDRTYTGKRLSKLADAGLFESSGGVYQLSDLGERFIAGEVDTEELEERDPT